MRRDTTWAFLCAATVTAVFGFVAGDVLHVPGAWLLAVVIGVGSILPFAYWMDRRRTRA